MGREAGGGLRNEEERMRSGSIDCVFEWWRDS